VDGIDNLPEEAERPAITTVLFNERVVSVVIAGDVGEETLTRLGEQVRDDIAALPGVTLAKLEGTRDEELIIEVPEAALRRHGLTLDDIVTAIGQASLTQPAGVIKAETGDIRLRTQGQAYRAEDFAAITVVSRVDGTTLRVGDLGSVRQGFAATNQLTRFDGKPAVFVDVERSRGQDMIEITRQVRGYIDGRAIDIPEGVEIIAWADDSIYLKGRIETLNWNAIGGLVLVFMVLLIAFEIELAFWVAVGTATAFMGALALMPYLGITLNMLSMFAFILVLGIVVDDAIIVSESIYAHAERASAGVRSAVEGALGVAKPVIFSVATTMIAFAPMLFFTGSIGAEIKAVPILIMTILAFSLLESLLILPAHLSRLKAKAGGTNRIARLTAKGLNGLARKVYLPLLVRALAGRYSVVALFTVLSILTWTIVSAGWIPMRFEPDVPADWVEATVTLPPGSPFDQSRKVLERMEQAAIALRADLKSERRPDQPDLIRHIGSLVSGNEIQMFIETAPSETRDTPIADIQRRWRARIGPLPEAETVAIVSTLSESDKELQIELTASDAETLEAAAGTLEQKLGDYEGVHDITSSLRARERQLDIHLRPEAHLLGITTADVARTLRQGFFGEDVQRVPTDRGDLKEVVRYPDHERHSLAFLDAINLRTEEGVEIPFHAVAELRHGQGPSDIRRKDRRRSATIEADVDAAVTSANQILDDLDEQAFWDDLQRRYPDLRMSTDEEEEAFLGDLQRNGIIALFAIYALMAIAFKSYLQPIVIITAIPFGFVGAVIGHALFGLDLSMNSLLGMVAASGVVINDNLVLIDGINRARDKGLAVFEAVLDAARTRFRPILITSVTTFIGLLPIMLERSLQAQFLIPMAVSLAFGVLFATWLTLVLVPSIYLIIEDIGNLKGIIARRSRDLQAPLPSHP
ncbi:MAG: efflux RND transporter permease subunit, partial [Geminicoccaceae bacterium]